MVAEGRIRVELGYARPDKQVVISLDVIDGATVESVIRKSGFLERFKDIDLKRNQVGIFGKTCALNAVLRAGDRVEIYRPLITDPKAARRRRAEISSARKVTAKRNS